MHLFKALADCVRYQAKHLLSLWCWHVKKTFSFIICKNARFMLTMLMHRLQAQHSSNVCVISGHGKLVPETQMLSVSTTRLEWMRQSDKRLCSTGRKLALYKLPVRLSQCYLTHSATRVCTEMDRYELPVWRELLAGVQGPVREHCISRIDMVNIQWQCVWIDHRPDMLWTQCFNDWFMNDWF